MPAAEELIAHGRSELEIQEFLGCDWLIYQDLEDLEVAVREGNPDIKQFDSSCFNGEYITGIEPGYFERIQQLRSDDARSVAAPESPNQGGRLAALVGMRMASAASGEQNTAVIDTLDDARLRNGQVPATERVQAQSVSAARHCSVRPTA